MLKIYERYFVKDATDQVNLPNHMVRSITVNVEKRNLNRTLYDAAQVSSFVGVTLTRVEKDFVVDGRVAVGAISDFCFLPAVGGS